MGISHTLAPELAVTRWFGADEGLTLESLRGRVVVLEAFQMLCPGCVTHGLPQAQRVHDTFRDDVVVLGLHTVFEHHEAMTPVSLEAFLSEYRITFPVGVDRHEPNDPMPVTMRRYVMRGTPTMIVVDRMGMVRHHAFGQQGDLELGATIAQLVSEPAPPESHPITEIAHEADCDAQGCAVPEQGATP